MIFDNKQFKIPRNSYVSVNNKVFDADVYIELPIEEIFSFSDCIAIFFISDVLTRKYFQFDYFKTFSNKELNKINLWCILIL